MSKLKVNKKHKDKLFRKIFRKKKDLLALYNALNGTAYTNEEDLEITTLSLLKDVFIPKPRYSFQHLNILYSIMVQKTSQKGKFYALVTYLYRKRKLRLWNVLLLC